MEFRTLGSTGLRVSSLSFGCSPFGGAFRPVEPAEAKRAVDRALDGGINFFDVAPYYGLTRAETVLGQALKGIARDRYVLATKVGRYGERDFDFSAARATASVDESLERLGCEHIDLIQCHDIEFGSLDQVVEETLPALQKLQRSGKVRFIGITGLPLHIFSYVMDRAGVDTVLSYCRYTLANTELTGLLPRFAAGGTGVINAAPLCMGLLTAAGPPSWHPADDALRSRCANAVRWCAERGVDIAALGLQFALQERRIHTTLVGISSADEVDRNLRAVEQPFDTDFADLLRRQLAAN